MSVKKTPKNGVLSARTTFLGEPSSNATVGARLLDLSHPAVIEAVHHLVDVLVRQLAPGAGHVVVLGGRE